MATTVPTVPTPLREHRLATASQIEYSRTLTPHLKEVAQFYADVSDGINQDVVGHHDAKAVLLVATAYCGHTYLVAAPGTAKSRLIKSLAAHLGISCATMSLTAEHQPSDATGWQFFDQAQHAYQLVPGPLTSGGIVLFDEFNRGTAYMHAGILEPMEDGVVRIDNLVVPIPKPGILVATANPVDWAINPVALSNLDRFMVHTRIHALSDPADQLHLMLNARKYDQRVTPLGREQQLSGDERRRTQGQADQMLRYRGYIRDEVRIEEAVATYMRNLVTALRAHPAVDKGASDDLTLRDGGGGDRGLVHLVAAAKAHAVLCSAEGFVSPDDVQAMLAPVWAHRMVLDGVGQLSDHAFAGATAVILQVLEQIPVPW